MAVWQADIQFSRSLGVLLDLEGGYVNDPDDPGGETKYGISKKSYPNLDIAGLSRDDAAEIYYRDFWEPYAWAQLPAPLGERCFLLAVNAGPPAAAKVLQRALRSATGVVLAVDGKVGPRTLHVARRANLDAALAAYRSEQAGHYRLLIAASSRLRRFEKGWLRRAYDDVG